MVDEYRCRVGPDPGRGLATSFVREARVVSLVEDGRVGRVRSNPSVEPRDAVGTTAFARDSREVSPMVAPFMGDSFLPVKVGG